MKVPKKYSSIKKEPFDFDKNKIWKPIKGYENYLISNYGDVYSHHLNALLKLAFKSNYYYVSIFNNNNIKCTIRVHILIYKTFIGKRNTNKVIDHIDRNKKIIL